MYILDVIDGMRCTVEFAMVMTTIDWVRRLGRDENGATAIEYGLILALISVAAMIAMQTLGISLANMFSTVSSVINAAISAGP